MHIAFKSVRIVVLHCIFHIYAVFKMDNNFGFFFQIIYAVSENKILNLPCVVKYV